MPPCRCGSTTHQRISHRDCPLNPRTLANNRTVSPVTGRGRRTPPVPPRPARSSGPYHPTTIAELLSPPAPPTREQLLGEGYDSTDSSAVGDESSDSDDDEMTGIPGPRRTAPQIIQRSEAAMNNFTNTINQLLSVTENQVHNAEMRSLQNERDIIRQERVTLQRLEERINRDADASVAAERFFWENFHHYLRPNRTPQQNIKEPLQTLMADLDEHKEQIPEGLYLKWCDQLQNLYRISS